MDQGASMLSGAYLYIIIYLVVMVGTVVLIITSLWRGMRAQERMEGHLATIAAALQQRSPL